MRPRLRAAMTMVMLGALLAGQLGQPREGWTYVIDNFWPDGDNIVMDDVFLPAATWSAPAQNQLAEWNEVDTTDNSHPFRINASPQFSFGADDGDNTMGFLGEAGLNSEYGLSYASALAWTVCWSGFFSGRIDECDMMLDPTLPWSLSPDPSNFFQSTVLHEAGHIRGLDHFNSFLSIEMSGTDKILRGETLYMDDKEAVRQHATHVAEHDMAIYNKFHTGSLPQWMSSSPTTARVGEVISFSNITVENRGTNAFGPLRFGAYLSTNSIISTADTLLNTGSFSSFGRFTFSTFNWSVTVPSVNDCGTYFIGGIIDDNSQYAERFEGNNAVAFVNGTPDPQPFTIRLARDFLEPNDSFGAARTIALPFSSGSLSIDADLEQDFYRFTLASPSQVSIALTFTHAAGDVDLDLRDAGNVVLQSSTSTGNGESITRSLGVGTYYVRAYGFGSGSCNRYSMTVSATPTVPTVTITAMDPTAAEMGLAAGTFKVTRSGSPSGVLAVGYTLRGTATNGTDYQSLSGSVNIPNGAASATFKVKPINDTLVEGSETVIATLAPDPAVYVTGQPNTATVTIADNDQIVVTITAPDATATETNASQGTFKVARTGPKTAPLTVSYGLSGTAANGADYLSLPGTVIIPAGAASATFKVKPVNDTLVEANETVVATLGASAAYVIGSPNSATITIVDND